MNTLKNFFRQENISAYILLLATFVALAWSNSPWQTYYHHFFNAKWTVNITNEALMTLFFFVVGLEIKYALIVGSLNSRAKALLPAIAAAGGMIFPIIIYVSINFNNAPLIPGWAIPTATDIAFSLGVLSLLGSRVSPALKVFLMALAIFDDLAAIVIIAIFYTEKLSLLFLGAAFVLVIVLWGLQYRKIEKFFPYFLVGVGLWLCLLKGGIHPTISGVVVALFMPLNSKLNHQLHPWITFVVLPLFVLVNAGVSVIDITWADLQWSLIIGIAAGLFFGKQIGVFIFCWLAVKLKWAELPTLVKWRELYAVAILCGIGFTISLFIGNLAFGGESLYLDSVKIGVIFGSFVSGIVGYALMRYKPVKTKVE